MTFDISSHPWASLKLGAFSTFAPPPREPGPSSSRRTRTPWLGLSIGLDNPSGYRPVPVVRTYSLFPTLATPPLVSAYF
ncbi:hypothetical protein GWK48_07510 [Metallosphaera tengchongensis]|uniref:Uncharacterized protein n=1 Tax=Metallosphaera tengchongensis TaxID=1532350 RepID=A0A6N0NYM2_9CREN|nr:hypothetical protein [Metallosphaera tengchongensis]QKR00241.1 hypothetical protein GWK48_07510 [Metallosphaera tengchongensis]